MQIQVQHLVRDALDWAVHFSTGAEGLKRVEDELTSGGALPYCFDLHHDIKLYSEAIAILNGEPHSSCLGAQELRLFAAEMGYLIDEPTYPPYSSDWALMGPIKTRERITSGPANSGKFWAGRGAVGDDDVLGCTGETELEAIARCYVAQKQGESVEVPPELVEWCQVNIPPQPMEPERGRV